MAALTRGPFHVQRCPISRARFLMLRTQSELVDCFIKETA
jgi:hypothetical protein